MGNAIIAVVSNASCNNPSRASIRSRYLEAVTVPLRRCYTPNIVEGGPPRTGREQRRDDCARCGRAVKRVEMDPRHAALQQFERLHRRVGNPQVFDRLHVSFACVHLNAQLRRDTGSAESHETLYLAEIRDRHQSGKHRQADAGATDSALEPEKLRIVEEELRHQEIGARFGLCLERRQIRIGRRCLRMFFRVARRADAKIVVPPQHGNELVGVFETSDRWDELRAGRRITAQCQDVLDAGSRQLVEQRSQLGAAGADAGNVRDHRQPDLLLNFLCKRDRSRSRRAARAVGNRYERRTQWRKRLDRRHELSRTGIVFGRKKFEREKGALTRERVADAHVCVAYRKLPATPPQSSAQPSTMTKSRSLTGSDTTGGLSIIIPRPINIAATAKSIATKGR